MPGNVYRARHRAFTLIEILVVLAIIGMITGVIAWNVWGSDQDARRDIARTEIRALKQAVMLHRIHTNRLPGTVAL
jgi:general secretion pathway protein G